MVRVSCQGITFLWAVLTVQNNAPPDSYLPLARFASQQEQAFMAGRQARAAKAVAKARGLITKGKTHQRNRDQLNAEAAQYIFDGGSTLSLLARGCISGPCADVDDDCVRPQKTTRCSRPDGWTYTDCTCTKRSSSRSKLSR